jgi:hypothetical protein
MLHSKTTPGIRVISLLWTRMGTARIYVLVAASVVIVLAAVGLFHLGSVANQSAQSPRKVASSSTPGLAQPTAGSSAARSPKTGGIASPGDQASVPSTPLPMGDDAIADHPAISITDLAPRRRRGWNGQTRVDVKIGVTPQADAKKGDVEIRVSFFDVTRNGEMRPTAAQVAYEWLTPVRDWTDPTPKYLVATYLQPRVPRRSPERLQYGGFIVRVYFDGQLQDARAEPDGLLAALGAGGQPRSAPGAMPAESPTVAAAAAPSPTLREAPVVKTEVASNAIIPAPTTPTLPQQKRSVEEAAALPYARPVPGKPGLVYSPFDEKFLIDVRGVPPGTVVNDPHAGKSFRVP